MRETFGARMSDLRKPKDWHGLRGVTTTRALGFYSLKILAYRSASTMTVTFSRIIQM